MHLPLPLPHGLILYGWHPFGNIKCEHTNRHTIPFNFSAVGNFQFSGGIRVCYLPRAFHHNIMIIRFLLIFIIYIKYLFGIVITTRDDSMSCKEIPRGLGPSAFTPVSASIATTVQMFSGQIFGYSASSGNAQTIAEHWSGGYSLKFSTYENIVKFGFPN